MGERGVKEPPLRDTSGAASRDLEEVTAGAWSGLVTLIQRRINDASLAMEFPTVDCPDGSSITGTNKEFFYNTLKALVPQLQRLANESSSRYFSPLNPEEVPPTPVALDVIDFVSQNIAYPVNTIWHDYFRHDHYVFDDTAKERGQAKFRREVELIFERNGIAFTISSKMFVVRLGPPEARPTLSDFTPNTDDPDLDAKLRDAHRRFLSRNPRDRLDALEKLWDAFERLKTLELAGNKSDSIKKLIEDAAPTANFRAVLDSECRSLTKIGNEYHIRHFEHDKAPLPTPIETSVDYLFTRLIALIAYLLRKTGRM